MEGRTRTKDEIIECVHICAKNKYFFFLQSYTISGKVTRTLPVEIVCQRKQSLVNLTYWLTITKLETLNFYGHK